MPYNFFGIKNYQNAYNCEPLPKYIPSFLEAVISYSLRGTLFENHLIHPCLGSQLKQEFLTALGLRFGQKAYNPA